MPSIHAIRWIENLKGESHELYWFDILDRGNFNISNEIKINKITSWKKRKKKYIRGEYFLRKKAPLIYYKLQPYLETTIDEQLVKIIKDIKPDIVHSFEMQGCSYPILKTMLKYPKLTWVYSCWGSDLYYYQNFKRHKKKIEKILKRIQVLHTDCKRDYLLAKKMGFNGDFVGVIPGGTGYDLKLLEAYKKPIEEREIILVKGYEHNFGRALNVLKALNILSSKLVKYKVVVFGAHKKVVDFINKNELNFKVFHRDELSHDDLIVLMGKAKIYIGNSISDGMPNTLLEAIVMNAFPIQSNPGGASAEVIEHDVNGLLISDPENINLIKIQILKALQYDKQEKLHKAATINTIISNKKLEYSFNKKKIINFYRDIEIDLACVTSFSK